MAIKIARVTYIRFDDLLRKRVKRGFGTKIALVIPGCDFGDPIDNGDKYREKNLEVGGC